MPLLAEQEIATPTPVVEEKYGDWVKICEKVPESEVEICGLVQNVMIKESGQSVLKAVVRKQAEGTSILLNLPLGFSLPQGVKIAVDDSEGQVHPVQTCTQTGCLTGWLMDTDYINALKAGARMHITIVDMNKTPFQIPLSLTGFTKGFGAL
jgi:invasion protein IalB